MCDYREVAGGSFDKIVSIGMVEHVENLRERYARTLRLWLGRLEATRARAIEVVGEARYRVWRIFLAASPQGFAAGRTEVFQAVLARPETAGAVRLPWSRADLYSNQRDGV